MPSLAELLIQYNTKAVTMDLKPRKSFRDRKDAFESLQKVGIEIEPPPPVAEGNGKKAKKAKGKKAKGKKAKATAKGKARAQPKNLVTEEDNPELAVFVTRNGSKQHNVLAVLLEAKEPMTMKEIAETAGTGTAIAAIINGIQQKLAGKLLRGGPRPKFKLVKSKDDDKEVRFKLEKE